MKAAFATENGRNDMEGAYAPGLPKAPPQLPPQQQVSAFMDERAYAALVRPETPGMPRKPVMRWLDAVQTPTQPNGPEFPPTPEIPPSATMPRLQPNGRIPQPQSSRPALNVRDTMTTDTTGTTDTTNTSVRWYG